MANINYQSWLLAKTENKQEILNAKDTKHRDYLKTQKINNTFSAMVKNFEEYSLKNERLFFELEDYIANETEIISALQNLATYAHTYICDLLEKMAINSDDKKGLSELVILGRR